MLFSKYIIFNKTFSDIDKKRKIFNIEKNFDKSRIRRHKEKDTDKSRIRRHEEKNTDKSRIRRYKNQPGYALLPANPHLRINREGDVIFIENPRRWKRVLDKEKEINNENNKISFIYNIKDLYIEELGEINPLFGKINISIEFLQNNTINFKHDAYAIKEIELNDFNTNSYNLPKILKSIEKEQGKMARGMYVEDLITNIVIKGDDEVKLGYLDYFINEDYLKDFIDEISNAISNDEVYTPIPTYRHFLQLLLSLNNTKILKNDKLYRDFFKSLLILDWVQDRDYYSSVLESLLFYGIKLFGKKLIKKITGLDEKFLDDITKLRKVPVPLLNVKKKNFLNALFIIKEMYQETQNMIDKFIESGKLTKLYRGSVIRFDVNKFNSKEDLINNIVELYRSIKKEEGLDMKEKVDKNIINIFKNDNNIKLIESWTSDINIAKNFSKLNHRHVNLVDIINDFSEEEFKSFIEKYMIIFKDLRIGVIFEVDAKENRDLLRKVLFTYNSFYKYWKNVKKIQNYYKYILTGKKPEDLTLIRILPAVLVLDVEHEFGLLIGIQKQLKHNNISVAGIIL